MKALNLVSLSLTLAGAAVVAVGAALPAQAMTITFDEIPGQFDPIANGYQGLNWDSFGAVNVPGYNSVFPSITGLNNSLISGDNIATNLRSPATVSSTTAFTLNSAFLTGVLSNGFDIQVQGFLGATQLYNQTVVASTSAPTLFTFNFQGVDRVTFTSFDYFAMDNLVVNEPVNASAVPVPPQFLATAVGAGLSALKLRKGKKDTGLVEA
jgi:hypothetical protein